MSKNNTQKGQVIIINTLMFFALSVAIIFALTTPVVSSFNITSSFSKSKEAFLLANSATNEAFYKLNTNKTLASAETLSLAQGDAIITSADTGNGKTITIQSDVDTYQRNYQIDLITGSGVSFSYGLQTGQGGFYMINNATIEGNVYSSGPIIGENNAYITGTAISSNISDPVSIVSNGGVIDPLYQIDFGANTVSIPQDVAQSFTVSTTTPIASLRILIKKTASPPSDITLQIKNNSSGNPGNTTYTSGTISASTVTSSWGYITVQLNNTAALTPGTTYWMVFDSGSNTNVTRYYSIAANDSSYLTGNTKKATTGSTWSDISTTTRDVYFDIYTGGETGLIEGMQIDENAWAHEINDSTIAGEMHCQVGSNNGGKACNTSWADPVEQSWPISEGNIQEWKDTAEAGTATSSISLSGNSVRTLNSTKVTGNVTLSGDAIIYLNGTLYVTGNITLSDRAQIKVNPALGASGIVVVSDGRIKTSNSGQFNNSGTTGSYIMVVTTSTCPTGGSCGGSDAIEIDNNSGSVILNAQNGTISFNNNASAKQATAYKIEMSNNTVVTYESGLMNPTFTSGPSGAWTIGSWKEVE
jgi:hypothetical protein